MVVLAPSTPFFVPYQYRVSVVCPQTRAVCRYMPSAVLQRLASLVALLKEQQPTKQDVEELLMACTDTRLLSVDKQRKLGIDTVQRMAWRVLRQPFALDHETLNMVLEALDTS